MVSRGLQKVLREHARLLFGPLGGIGILWIVTEWVDRADFFAGILSGESGVEKMVEWLAYHPSLFVVGILASGQL